VNENASESLAAVELAKAIVQTTQLGQSAPSKEFWFDLYRECLGVIRAGLPQPDPGIPSTVQGSGHQHMPARRQTP
jgi:hypothetical protein